MKPEKKQEFIRNAKTLLFPQFRSLCQSSLVVLMHFLMAKKLTKVARRTKEKGSVMELSNLEVWEEEEGGVQSLALTDIMGEGVALGDGDL